MERPCADWGWPGFQINSCGTTIMVDPLLEGFDMPIMIDMPIAAKDVPELDAIDRRLPNLGTMPELITG